MLAALTTPTTHKNRERIGQETFRAAPRNFRLLKRVAQGAKKVRHLIERFLFQSLNSLNGLFKKWIDVFEWLGVCIIYRLFESVL